MRREIKVGHEESDYGQESRDHVAQLAVLRAHIRYVRATLDKVLQTLVEHDKRMRDIENWQLKKETQLKTSMWMIGLFWTAVQSLILFGFELLRH